MGEARRHLAQCTPQEEASFKYTLPTEFRSIARYSVLEERGSEGQKGIAMQKERGGDGVAGGGRQ